MTRATWLLVLFTGSAAGGCWRSAEPADEAGDIVTDPEPVPQQREAPPAEVDYPPASALHPPSSRDVCEGPDGPCRTFDECDGTWVAGPLPAPWWAVSPPAECQTSLHHERLEYLDDCEGGSHLPPVDCGAGNGDAICAGVRVTTLCLSTTDCPAGMLCTDDGSGEFAPSPGLPFGVCRQICAHPGERRGCLRCEDVCNSHGLCVRRFDLDPDDIGD